MKNFLSWVKTSILEEFGLKNLDPVKCFLGVCFEQSWVTKELWLHQRDYIKCLLSDFGLSSCNCISTSMELDKSTVSTDPPLDSLFPCSEYQALVGHLLFILLFSCPDISFTINRLTQHNSYLQQRHFLAIKRVLHYLTGSCDLCLHFNSQGGTISNQLE